MPERVIVVGAGGISHAWFPALRAEQVDVHAVVDVHLAAAEARIAEYALTAEASTDLRAMLKKYRPDFVLDLTIPEAHCAVTCAALRAGYPVIGEKPMAANMAQARRMVRTAEETGMLYMVSQSRRWEPRHAMIRDAIDAGHLGEITTINSDFYLGAHFGGFRDAMESPLILDMAIHHFDLARYFTGADPVAVYAREFNPRGSWYAGAAAASCTFEMTNGIIFTYRGSWCAEGCHTSWHGDWRIIGTQGTVIYAQDTDPHGQVVTPDASGFHRPLQDLPIADAPMRATGMHAGLCQMLTFVRTGQTPQTECHDNIKSLAMVFAAMESARKGRRVEISPKRHTVA